MIAHLYPGSPSTGYSGGTVALNTQYYDLSKVVLITEEPPPGGEDKRRSIGIIALIILAVLALAFLVSRRRKVFRTRSRSRTRP